MQCHFVYSVPHPRAPIARIERRIRGIGNRLGFSLRLVRNRRPNDDEFETWESRSPFENTKNIFRALSAKIPTNLYHLTERVNIQFDKDDVFLGHPLFPHTPDGVGVTEMAANQAVRPRIFALIAPLHCDPDADLKHINKGFLEDIDRLMPSADVLFAIMGEYWWDQWEFSKYKAWKQKMVRLDMAVDCSRYPRVKIRFNKAGGRGFLFVGASDDPRKGAAYFSALMNSMPGVRCGWIGDGPEIPGVPRISRFRRLSPDFMSMVAEKFDVFVSPAVADPNPTTILESMAWGLPVACTPQSGYYATPYRKNLDLSDMAKSIEILNALQFESDDKLHAMADEARKIVESEYNWAAFSSRIIERLGI